jgi:hypothetical protein
MPEQIIKKLQFKQQPLVLVLDSPSEFSHVLLAWKKLTEVHTKPDKKKKYPLALAFVQSESDVQKQGTAIIKQLEEDGVFWMVYPKKTSKKYAATITRDIGWSHLGELGYEPVSMVAIDEDWSALRFRNADKIKSMIRRQPTALSQKGREKTVNKTNKAIKSGKG